MFTLFGSDYVGSPGNCLYPHRFDVSDADSLKEAVRHDYVCAEYKNSYRNGANYLSADCLPVDCDNDHSDDPALWVTPEDVAANFPGVRFAVHYSRHHMKEKNGAAARPKFHVLFPIDPITDADAYSDLKKLVNTIFPFFDTKALDAARFFFGTAEPNVEICDGIMNLTDFLRGDEYFEVKTYWGWFRLDRGAYEDYLAGKLWITWVPGKRQPQITASKAEDPLPPNVTAEAIRLRDLSAKQGLYATLQASFPGAQVEIPYKSRMKNKPIDEMALSVRSSNGLMRANAGTFGRLWDLMTRETGLRSVRNLGAKSEAEIKKCFF